VDNQPFSLIFVFPKRQRVIFFPLPKRLRESFFPLPVSFDSQILRHWSEEEIRHSHSTQPDRRGRDIFPSRKTSPPFLPFPPLKFLSSLIYFSWCCRDAGVLMTFFPYTVIEFFCASFIASSFFWVLGSLVGTLLSYRVLYSRHFPSSSHFSPRCLEFCYLSRICSSELLGSAPNWRVPTPRLTNGPIQ